MSLLESVVAFIILSIAAVACLDLSRSAVDARARSNEWQAAVTRAEAALATERLGLPNTDPAIRVIRTHYTPGVDRVDVHVPVAGTATFELSRLVPAPRARALQ